MVGIRIRLALIIVLALAVGAGIGSTVAAKVGRSFPLTGRQATLFVEAGGSQGAVPALEPGFAAMLEQVLPTVVNIATSKVVQAADGAPSSPFFSDPFFERFFGDEFSRQYRVPRERRERSRGSGVIVSADGYVLTNNHVVEGADEVVLTFAEGQEYEATVVGTDRQTDVAILKVDADDLTARQLELPAGTTGVVVSNVAPGTRAAEAGLRQGDVIVEVNRQAVADENAYARAVRGAGDEPVLLLVNRGGTRPRPSSR